MPVFYLCCDVYKFTRDHATLRFPKPSRVFYVTSTCNKTTNDYMKYTSKMAENRICEIFNSVLKNKLNKRATEQSEKLSDLKSKATLKKKYIWTQINFNEIVSCIRCGFLVASLSTKLSKKQVYKFKRWSGCCFNMDIR